MTACNYAEPNADNYKNEEFTKQFTYTDHMTSPRCKNSVKTSSVLVHNRELLIKNEGD